MKRKGRGLTIKINFTNRWLYTLIAIGILAAIAVGVYALAPGIAPNPGHTIADVAPPSPCSASQYLQFDGTNWKCATINTNYTETDPTIPSSLKNGVQCSVSLVNCGNIGMNNNCPGNKVMAGQAVSQWRCCDISVSCS